MEYEKNETSKNTKNKSKIAFVFGIFMVALYFGMGILLIFFDDTFEWKIPETARIILGTLLVLYGTYRGYRMTSRNN